MPVRVLLAVILLLFLSPLAGSGAAQEARHSYPPGFQVTLLVAGLPREPTSLSIAPDGRLFVTIQDGRVYAVRNGALSAEPFLSVAVDQEKERGLLSLAFPPGFPQEDAVYVYYTAPAGEGQPPRNRVSRFRVSAADPDRADPASEEVLLDGIPSETGFHNGGAVHVAPDGLLYVATGDGGRGERAQDLGSLSGKILRLRPDGSIPADNPFVEHPEARGEVWAYGLRNPFTFALDAATGRLFANDVGTWHFEEINAIRPGANYGWPLCEGPCDQAHLVDPLHAYTTHEGGAITGGTFATGSQFPPGYRGYLFADYIGGWVKHLDPASRETRLFVADAGGPLDLDIGPDGALYVLALFDKAIYRVAWTGEPHPHAQIRVVEREETAPARVRLSAEDSRDPHGLPLSFLWDLGDGTWVEGATVEHRYERGGEYLVKLIVHNAAGVRDESHLRLQVAAARPPAISITAPAEGRVVWAGDALAMRAEARSASGEPLPDEALTWLVHLHHDEHTHPLLGPVPGGVGSFTIPRRGEWEGRLWYEVHVTARDAAGATAEATRAIYPARASLRVESDLGDLPITVDGIPHRAPFELSPIVGQLLRLEAPAQARVDGVEHQFTGWADAPEAGPAREITVHDSLTLRALYAPAEAPGSPPAGGVAHASASLSGSPPAGVTHTVQPGDELRHIAASYGLTVWDVLAANDIPDPDSLRVGHVLTIPIPSR